MQAYVCAQLGASFIAPPTSTMADVFADSASTTPVIYIALAGVDAAAPLKSYAASLSAAAQGRLVSISLGQGQGAIAEAAIEAATISGSWVRAPATPVPTARAQGVGM